MPRKEAEPHGLRHNYFRQHLKNIFKAVSPEAARSIPDESINEPQDSADALQQPSVGGKGPVNPLDTRRAVFSSVASSLAAMELEESVRKGNSIEIPSLGICITKEALQDLTHDE